MVMIKIRNLKVAFENYFIILKCDTAKRASINGDQKRSNDNLVPSARQ